MLLLLLSLREALMFCSGLNSLIALSASVLSTATLTTGCRQKPCQKYQTISTMYRNLCFARSVLSSSSFLLCFSLLAVTVLLVKMDF